ncbi:putative RNA-binding Zn ribbon-like protein [Mycobacterium sp. BK558]|nr:putative RNA-binding Zn ribbon-like protein [Mycobacterium sp. BK558]
MTTDRAPGSLESVRALLNTWQRPGGRQSEAVDTLADLVADAEGWQSTVHGSYLPAARDVEELRELRTALREVLGCTHPKSLQRWITRFDVRPALTEEGSPWPLAMIPGRSSCAGELLCAALDAVNRDVWQRLRSCPDCEYVFFDSSRNGSRTWCRMTRDDPSGRSCGTLAKARAKRARDRAGRTA